jgi:hypothetical protein
MMSDDLREFTNEMGNVVFIRRDKVSLLKDSPFDNRIGVTVLVEGKLFWLQADYEAVRDWVRGT